MAEEKVTVKQVRSANRTRKATIATLQALGLGRIGRTKEHTLSPAVRGMINAVAHLVQVEKR